MASDNIYDIAISELIARDSIGGSGNGSITESIETTIDTGPLIALDAIVPNPIKVTSVITNILDGWEIVVNSHKIFFSSFGGSFLQLLQGSSMLVEGDDTNNGITGTSAGQNVREYYSEITLEETASPGNFRSITSLTIGITTVKSIYFGFNNVVPGDTADLSNSVLSGTFELKIISNFSLEDFYIAIPSNEAQPFAVADEHGLISEITEYPIIGGAILNFTLYRYKWTIELTGSYLHTFTLIYS